jgi:alpha-L-rhamnosidase
MTSFNHYALGAVVDWLHRCVGGLSPLEPGYRTVLVRPLPGGGLTSAQTRFQSGYGETSVSWRLEGESFSCDVVVPPGVSAQLDLPVKGWEPRLVGSGACSVSGTFQLLDCRGGLGPGSPWYVGPRA